MPFVRAIGRWTMTALVINSIIGNSIFGLPSELSRLLGRASPLAMVLCGLVVGLIMACIGEVASQFSDPGGIYLYVRTAFGRLAGVQLAWFQLLASSAGGAANASLFMIYLAGLLPGAGRGIERVALLAILIAVPTVANYVGVRSGARLNNVLTVAKLLPLALIIVLGLIHFSHHAEMLRPADISGPGLGAWLRAMLFLFFAYAGAENALIPSGEIENPRRTIPFALLAGLGGCAVIYTLVQFVTVATIGAGTGDRPLAETASVLIGRRGELFVTIAVMISTYGWLSGAILNVPRLACSLSMQGDLPGILGKLHVRFHTPAIAIICFAAIIWLLAASGAYLWIAAVGAGAIIVLYAGGCAALIGLRRQRRQRADALRIPFGPGLAVAGILMLIAVLTRLQLREAFLMLITAAVASANWWWAKRENARKGEARIASAQRGS